MRIGELARRAGVDVQTVRCYEREKLLPAAARTGSGYRAYGASGLERLSFIRHCRSLDMPLAEIRRLLDPLGGRAGALRGGGPLVAAHLERVRARRATLEALETRLATLKAQCASRQRVADCGILAELVHAAQGAECACHPHCKALHAAASPGSGA